MTRDGLSRLAVWLLALETAFLVAALAVWCDS